MMLLCVIIYLVFNIPILITDQNINQFYKFYIKIYEVQNLPFGALTEQGNQGFRQGNFAEGKWEKDINKE